MSLCVGSASEVLCVSVRVVLCVSVWLCALMCRVYKCSVYIREREMKIEEIEYISVIVNMCVCGCVYV